MDTNATQTPNQSSSRSHHRNQELIERLIRLCQIDIDASYSYEAALDFIESDQSNLTHDRTMIESLERFRDDHTDHVFTLSSAIFGIGGEPPDIALDWKGFILEGFTTVSSFSGTKGALQALRVDEQIIRESYEEAMKWDVPSDLRRLLEENRNDELRHASFIEEALNRIEARLDEEEDENAEHGIGDGPQDQESEGHSPTYRFR